MHNKYWWWKQIQGSRSAELLISQCKQISLNWLVKDCTTVVEAHHSSIYNPHGHFTAPAHRCWWLSPVCPRSGSRFWCQLSSESLWSQAPYPGACPRWLWPPGAAGSTSEKISVSGDHNRGRPLKHHVSEKHVNPGCVTQSVMSFFPHQLLLFITQQGFWISYCAPACECVCRIQSGPHGYTHKILMVFSPRKHSGSTGVGCGLILTHHRAKGLTRPRGGGETEASSRGKAGEVL